MARQTSSIKAIGTVDDLNFYSEAGAYRARRKTGVTSQRFHKDAAYANSRASSYRFGRANTLVSLVYRYVLPGYTSDTLSSLCKKQAIALMNKSLTEEEVLRSLHSFLDSLHALAITEADFELHIPGLLREAAARAQAKMRRRKNEKKEKVVFIISEPPTEEDKA